MQFAHIGQYEHGLSEEPAGLDARMWCERVSAAAGNVMSTGVEGEVEEEQRHIRFGCVVTRLSVRLATACSACIA